MNRADDSPADSSPGPNTRDRHRPSVWETAPATDLLAFPNCAVLPEATAGAR